MVDESGRLRSFAEGLNDPKGLDAWQGSLFVTNKTRVLRVRDGGGPPWLQMPRIFRGLLSS